MCGRASLSKTEKELEKRFRATFYTEDLQQLPFPNYNIAPTHRHPVITNEDKTHFQLFKWGLIPFWASSPQIGSRLINARIESVSDKPAFRAALSRRRCLVPIDGFYEWKKNGSTKTPYRIHQTDDSPFALAGLWEVWKDENEQKTYSFTVLTQAPNELMAEIHDRMPAILLPEQEQLWLDTHLPTREVLAMIQPYPSELLHAYPVSRRVGKVSENDAGLLEEVKYEDGEQGTLF